MASSLGSWEEFPTNADGLGAAFDLAVESFERVGVVQLAPRRSADDDHLHGRDLHVQEKARTFALDDAAPALPQPS